MGVKSSAQTHAAAGQSALSSLHAGLPCGHKQACVHASVGDLAQICLSAQAVIVRQPR